MVIDHIILLAYFISVLVIGILSGKKLRNFREFAVAQKQYTLPVMVATLFATVIGGGSTFGISTRVFSSGIIFLFAFYGAVLNKLIVARYVAPQFDERYKSFISIGDIMEEAYGKIGKIISGICITLVSIGSVGSQVTAIGFTLDYLTGIPFTLGVIIGFGVLIFYSSFGGVRSVIATDVLQFILMLAFIPIVFFLGLKECGGIITLFESLPSDKLSFYPNPEVFLKSLTMFVILSLSALDPSFIQRLLISKNSLQASRITQITGYLSLPFFTIMGFLGLISFKLNPSLDPNHALVFIINNVLPIGLKGLAVVGILSALMSTADSDLHIVGVSVVQDVILPLDYRNLIKEKHKLIIARVLTLTLGTGSVLIALYFQNIINIMVYAFSFWGPTVLVPFIFCLYDKIFKQDQFIKGIAIGSITVLIWNLLLQDLTFLDGFIPGMLANTIYFTAILLKGKNSHGKTRRENIRRKS